jgi:hypothetical protein
VQSADVQSVSKAEELVLLDGPGGWLGVKLCEVVLGLLRVLVSINLEAGLVLRVLLCRVALAVLGADPIEHVSIR